MPGLDECQAKSLPGEAGMPDFCVAGGHEGCFQLSQCGKLLQKQTLLKEAEAYVFLHHITQENLEVVYHNTQQVPTHPSEPHADSQGQLISPCSASLCSSSSSPPSLCSFASPSSSSLLTCSPGSTFSSSSFSPAGNGVATNSRMRGTILRGDTSALFRCLFSGHKPRYAISSTEQKYTRKLLRFTAKCYKVDLHTDVSFTGAQVTLQNVTYGMQTPLVLDLKIGTRTYGDEATQAKRIRSEQQAEVRGSVRMGIAFCGMKGYDARGVPIDMRRPKTGEENQAVIDTLYGYTELFCGYLTAARKPSISLDIGRCLMYKLKELLWLFERQELFAFYGSSLLMVYDTSMDETCLSIAGNDDVVGLFIIDLAHVTVYNQAPDEGFIKGVRNVIAALDAAMCGITPNTQ